MKSMRSFISSRWPRHAMGRVMTDRITEVRFPATHALSYVMAALFVLQAITGVLLMMHYKPAAALAFDSVSVIANELEAGWLLRQFHVYNSQALIALSAIFVVHLFFQGMFRGKRDLLWYLSFFLLAVFLTSGFTGYLLPWNERAFWATVIVTDVPKGIPFLGPIVIGFLRGGAAVGDATLGRFFSAHVTALPLLAGFTIVLLIGFIRKIELEGNTETQEKGIASKRLFYLASILFYLVVGTVVTLGILFPYGTGEPADPFVTPDNIKPEWYFLPAYEAVKHFPAVVGELLILLISGGLFLVPLLSRRRPFSSINETMRRILGAVFIVLLIVLGVIGYLS